MLWNLSRACTRIRLAWADAGYSGKLAAWAASLKIKLVIVRKRDAHAFEVLPRRWVVGAAVACGTESRQSVMVFPSPRSRSPAELTYRVQR